jgi:hypothetical protein
MKSRSHFLILSGNSVELFYFARIFHIRSAERMLRLVKAPARFAKRGAACTQGGSAAPRAMLNKCGFAATVWHRARRGTSPSARWTRDCSIHPHTRSGGVASIEVAYCYSGGPPNLTVTSLEQFCVPASHTLYV